MEAFHKEPNTYRGTEVLYFENAELTKFKGDSSSYSTFGPLSILYFKDFKRFVLQLNDWRYPLFRRVPITKEGSPSSPSYILPALGGSSYRLNLSSLPNTEGLANFETILNHNADFSSSGEENTLRKLEASPDDKLYRHTGPIRKESGVKDAISGALKSASGKVKALKGSKGASKKKRSNLKDIKIRDFKSEAKSTFKKNYFEASQKLSEEFLNRRKSNINLSQVREFNDLRKTAPSTAAGFFIRREELEESILSIKDLITERSFSMDSDEKKGLIENIRHGIHGIRESITGMLGGNKPTESTEGSQPSTLSSERRTEGSISQNRPSREIISVHDKIEKVPAPEGMSHYQA